MAHNLAEQESAEPSLSHKSDQAHDREDGHGRTNDFGRKEARCDAPVCKSEDGGDG